MSFPDDDQLQHFRLLGGLTATDLWPALNFALVGWGLLVFAPKWKHSMTLTLIPPLLLATIYALGIFSLIFFPEKANEDNSADFTTLEGVVKMFKDPNIVFLGWIHYLVFDFLIGRMIAFDAVKRGVSMAFYICVVVPCLFFAFMLDPVGWLMYSALQATLLDAPSQQKKKDRIP